MIPYLGENNPEAPAVWIPDRIKIINLCNVIITDKIN